MAARTSDGDFDAELSPYWELSAAREASDAVTLARARRDLGSVASREELERVLREAETRLREATALCRARIRAVSPTDA